MTEGVYRLLKDFGFPVVIALGLLYMLNQQQKEASAERVDHTTIMIDQVADLREKIDALEKVCAK